MRSRTPPTQLARRHLAVLPETVAIVPISPISRSWPGLSVVTTRRPCTTAVWIFRQTGISQRRSNGTMMAEVSKASPGRALPISGSMPSRVKPSHVPDSSLSSLPKVPARHRSMSMLCSPVTSCLAIGRTIGKRLKPAPTLAVSITP